MYSFSRYNFIKLEIWFKSMGFDFQSENNNINNDLDYNYKQVLAENLDCPVENLASIVGPIEFVHIINKYTPDNFYTGDFLSEHFDELYQNVLNKTFRINLHMHTVESDGRLTVEELLNQAVIYADNVKSKINDDLPAFMISITNHDSLEGTKKALKIIAENPDKFKDIKFVTGIEFSVTLDNEKILKKPLATDLMGYCINPYDEDLNNFQQNIKNSRNEEAQKILLKLSEFGVKENWETVKNSHVLIKIAGSMAFFDFIKHYIYKNYKKSPNLIKHKEEIEKLFEGKQTEFSPTIKEVADVINKSFGYIGLAHPGRIHLSKIDESKVFPTKNRDFKLEGLYLLLKDSVFQGATLAESNYHYTMRHYSEELHKLVDVTNLFCEEANLLKTGGTDGHRANIFTHTLDLSDEELNLFLRS